METSGEERLMAVVCILAVLTSDPCYTEVMCWYHICKHFCSPALRSKTLHPCNVSSTPPRCAPSSPSPRRCFRCCFSSPVASWTWPVPARETWRRREVGRVVMVRGEGKQFPHSSAINQFLKIQSMQLFVSSRDGGRVEMSRVLDIKSRL